MTSGYSMINEIKRIAFLAGEILLKYRNEDLDIHTKATDTDFVTKADKESDELIRRELTALFPEDQILSEESAAQVTDFSGRVWVVDPLDGTSYYITKDDTFTVMIGLSINGKSTFGLVYAPVLKEYYWAEEGGGAWKQSADGAINNISVSTIDDLTIARYVVSPKFTGLRPKDAFVSLVSVNRDYFRRASGGLKAGLVAEGKADIAYFEDDLTDKYDFCAYDIITREAGGMFTDMQGVLIDYSVTKEKFPKILLCSNGKLHQELIQKFKEIKSL